MTSSPLPPPAPRPRYSWRAGNGYLWIKIIGAAVMIAAGSSGGVYGLTAFRLEMLEQRADAQRAEEEKLSERLQDLRTDQRMLVTRFEGKNDLDNAYREEVKRRLVQIEKNLDQLLRRQGMRAYAAPP